MIPIKVRTPQTNPYNPILSDMYKRSVQALQDTYEMAHSRTLRELYTDAFRPRQLKSNMTTVKSLATGEPVDVNMKYLFFRPEKGDTEHRFQYELRTQGDSLLGAKTFGVKETVSGGEEFTCGYMCSNKNDDYAGVQIRLLQAEIEEAQRKNVGEIPLTSLVPAVKFHTMMGFRPTVSRTEEVFRIEDIDKCMKECVEDNKRYIDAEYFYPIISEENGAYFFDRNRTLYCASMNKYNQLQAQSGKRHFSCRGQMSALSIDMKLDGKEYQDWVDRIKGFEITPDEGVNPKKMGFFQSVRSLISLFTS